jgi:manganese efflux pump family protein
MAFATSLFIAVGLAMDAFAVSLGIGTTGQANDRRSKFRLAFHFGVFQSGMTLLGWLAGSTIANFINSFDHWVALALLAFVGINMIRSGLNPECESYQSNPSKGGTLVMLCIATSLDAMAVGLSLAMLKTSILYPALVIGVVTAGLSIIGLLAGTKLGQTFGKRMEILGGLILVGIGIQVVLNHLLPPHFLPFF